MQIMGTGCLVVQMKNIKKQNRRKFASLQCMDSTIDFVADLYDLSIDEVKRAMDGEEYWCI